MPVTKRHPVPEGPSVNGKGYRKNRALQERPKHKVLELFAILKSTRMVF